jgi:hypothetical protein
MPLRESPTDVADDGAPCPRAAATTPTAKQTAEDSPSLGR